MVCLAEAVDYYPLNMTGCDRFRQAELREVLDTWDEWDLGEIDWRGTGAASKAQGSHDVRAFQAAVVDKSIRPGMNVLFPFALRNTTLRRDVAGNPALMKKTQKSRIDVLQAAVIAVGMSREWGVDGSAVDYFAPVTHDTYNQLMAKKEAEQSAVT